LFAFYAAVNALVSFSTPW